MGKKLTWEEVDTVLDQIIEVTGLKSCDVNHWQKGEHDRKYIQFRIYNKQGKLLHIKKCGYYDNVQNQYIAETNKGNYDILEVLENRGF